MISLEIGIRGSKWWWADRTLHRDNGPSIIKTSGYQAWYNYGKWHRTDGPAIIRPDGTVDWYNYGLLHRTDGPAVTCYDGTVEYWINDQRLSEYEHMFLTGPGHD